MDEISRNILRHQVLELRKLYRSSRILWLEAQQKAEAEHATCQLLRNNIQILQTDCDDAVEIDPCYPQDDVHFKAAAAKEALSRAK